MLGFRDYGLGLGEVASLGRGFRVSMSGKGKEHFS